MSRHVPPVLSSLECCLDSVSRIQAPGFPTPHCIIGYSPVQTDTPVQLFHLVEISGNFLKHRYVYVLPFWGRVKNEALANVI